MTNLYKAYYSQFLIKRAMLLNKYIAKLPFIHLSKVHASCNIREL